MVIRLPVYTYESLRPREAIKNQRNSEPQTRFAFYLQSTCIQDFQNILPIFQLRITPTGVRLKEVFELSFLRPAEKSFGEMAVVVSGAGVKCENVSSHVRPDSLALIRRSPNFFFGSAVVGVRGEGAKGIRESYSEAREKREPEPRQEGRTCYESLHTNLLSVSR